MSKNGLRVVIERRGDDLYWNMTDRGVEHTAKAVALRSRMSAGRSISICDFKISAPVPETARSQSGG